MGGVVVADDNHGKNFEGAWRPVSFSEDIVADSLNLTMKHIIPDRANNPSAIYTEHEFDIKNIKIDADISLNSTSLNQQSSQDPLFRGVTSYEVFGNRFQSIKIDDALRINIKSRDLDDVSGLRIINSAPGYINDYILNVNDESNVISNNSNYGYGAVYGIENRGTELQINKYNADITSNHSWLFGAYSYSMGSRTSVINLGKDSSINLTLTNSEDNENVKGPQGLRASQNGKITAGDNLSINIKSNIKNNKNRSVSYGLLAASDGSILVKNNANINVISNNSESLRGAAIATDYEPSSTIRLGDNSVISYINNNRDALGTYTDGGTIVTGDNTTINVSAGNNAVGVMSAYHRRNTGTENNPVYEYNYGKSIFGKNLKLNLDGGSYNIGFWVPGGNVELNGVETKANEVIHAEQGGKVLGNPGFYHLIGDIQGKQKSEININLARSSYFSGVTKKDSNSIINIALNDKSRWDLMDSASLTALSISGNEASLNILKNNLTLYSHQVDNAGGIIINDKKSTGFHTFTIDGNYNGNNGIVEFNTLLKGDNSDTDHFVVKGDTSGNTRVIVNNVGGEGAQTEKGIKVITVEGNSNGSFALIDNKPVRAGAYDYDLRKNDKNWYLTSYLYDDKDSVKPMIRPETGSYIANMAASNTLFNHRLHDRSGEPNYTDIFTGAKKTTSMWMRNVGGHTRFKDTADGKNLTNRYVLQLGGDVAQWTSQAGHRYHLGLMTGYAHASNRNTSQLTQRSSDGSVNGYSAGLYGTWYQNTDTANVGAYVDSWLLYNWFDNKVTRYSDEEKYKSKGITASLEAGYTYLIGQNGNKRYYLQPQTQIIYMGVHADDHWDTHNTKVTSGKDNIETRLGLRAYVNSYNEAIDSNKERQFQPFVEVNWLYHANDFDARFDGFKVEQKGWRNVGEIKLGTEGQINRNFNLWGDITQQIGDRGYSDTQAQLGFKYLF
ncbi:TPA: autotransporter outer membrane beta-barrel domain-containing protein [Morganella morganii]|nr:autotransporter outer membrane beta-barrel domain-containing protein [Morganella morganii]